MVVATGLLGVLLWPLGVRPAPVTGTAADTAVTSRSIAFFEDRLARDSANDLVAGRLIQRYQMRFATGADLGDIHRAERLARRLLVTAPDTGIALARLSGVLLTQHRFAEALSVARQATATDPGDADALGARFDAALAGGRYAEADSTLRRLPGGALETTLRRAQWMAAQGRPRDAYREQERVCRRLDRSGAHPTARAWCLTELAALAPEPAAEGLLRAALEAQPGYRGALEGLADRAHQRGDWSEARTLYRRIAADAHPDLYHRLAEAAVMAGDVGAARAFGDRFLALARDPRHEALFGSMAARFLADRGAPGDLDSALALASRDVARRPTVESYDLLAWVHLRRGEVEAALEASDSAHRWGAPSATMRLHRGLILERLGRAAEGRALVAEALADPAALDPEARIWWRRRTAARG